MHEGLGLFEPFIRQIDIHRPHLDRIGDVLDRTARKARLCFLDHVQIGADIGNGLELAIVLHEPVIDRHQPLFLGFGMFLIGNRHRFFDDLRLEQLVVTQRNIVVLAGKQREDVNIVCPRDRPVDEPSRPCPLAQGIINIFRIVREHAERAIAAHHGRWHRQNFPSTRR